MVCLSGNVEWNVLTIDDTFDESQEVGKKDLFAVFLDEDLF